MNLDSLRSSHPIEVVLEDANKIAESVVFLSPRSAKLLSAVLTLILFDPQGI